MRLLREMRACRQQPRIRIASVVAVAVVLAGAETASACSCIGPGQDQSLKDFVTQTKKQSDGVIVGDLVRIKEVGGSSGDQFEPVDFVFEIETTYKKEGRLEPGTRIRVRSPIDSGANCGLPDVRRLRTGMFLLRSQGRWTTNSCQLIPPRLLKKFFGPDAPVGSPARPAGGFGDCPKPART